MKKKIAILGSTGSIGKQTIEIVRRDKKNFKILLLTANKNHFLLSKQIKEFSVKNVIVKDKKSYLILKKNLKKLIFLIHSTKLIRSLNLSLIIQ